MYVRIDIHGMQSPPFFALPVWWFVGSVLDRVLSGKKIHRLIYMSSAFLCLSLLVLLIGILVSPPSDRSDLAWLLPGLVFWTVAFALAPFAAPRTGMVAEARSG